MSIKIVSNFHVFVPNGERDKKVAFAVGGVLGAGDMPVGHTMQDWKDKGLAVLVDVVGSSGGAEAGAAV